MSSIYKKIKKDWEVYCLIIGIAYIEETSKPYIRKDKRIYKGKNKKYINGSSIQIHCKDEGIIRELFLATKIWENKFNKKFVGKSFKNYKLSKYGKYYFSFTPSWIYLIIKTIGILPSKFTQNISIKRLKEWKVQHTGKILSENQINELYNKKSIYNKLFIDKELAAGAFIISLDLEFRGTTTGNPSLCMSQRYKDFLEFMLAVGNKWNWVTSQKLSKVDMTYRRKLGKAEQQFDFRVSLKSLEEIYNLGGPLADNHKDKCVKFHIKRSKSYINLGGKHKKNNTKIKILNIINSINKELTSVDLQFKINKRIDVILDHLHNLEKEGLIRKERKGKKYFWFRKNDN